MYKPRVHDYVIWHRDPPPSFEGWVYFVDTEYITIEIGVKDKPTCQYTANEKHKKIHTLLVCHPCYWKELEYVKNRREE
jgi:hypothetical protein